MLLNAPSVPNEPRQTSHDKPATSNAHRQMPEFTITNMTAEPYALPLTAPIDLGGTTIAERRGIVVTAIVDGPDGTQAVGLGDIAPLPAFSTESVTEAHAAVDGVRDQLVGMSFRPSTIRDWAISFGSIVKHAPTSVQFGIEQALLFAAARSAGVSPTSFLSETPRDTVSLNALLVGTPTEILDAADGVRQFSAVKVKVGRHDVQAEAQCIRGLSERWEGAVSIRLDANRAWSVEEANMFAEGLRGVEIEYLEEPLHDASQLEAWAEATGIPVALDETTREKTLAELARQTFASALIVKPTLIGFSNTLALADAMTPAGVDVVISSAYESGVGLAGLAVLAAAIGNADTPAGLDTYRRLASDVVQPRLDIGGPVVRVAALWEGLSSAQLLFER